MNEFQVTVTYTYQVSDADLAKYYDTTDLVEAALIDERNYNDDPRLLCDDLTGPRDDFKVLVKARKL